jgi:hypothetical protein
VTLFAHQPPKQHSPSQSHRRQAGVWGGSNGSQGGECVYSLPFFPGDNGSGGGGVSEQSNTSGRRRCERVWKFPRSSLPHLPKIIVEIVCNIARVISCEATKISTGSCVPTKISAVSNISTLNFPDAFSEAAPSTPDIGLPNIVRPLPPFGLSLCIRPRCSEDFFEVSPQKTDPHIRMLIYRMKKQRIDRRQ